MWTSNHYNRSQALVLFTRKDCSVFLLLLQSLTADFFTQIKSQLHWNPSLLTNGVSCTCITRWTRGHRKIPKTWRWSIGYCVSQKKQTLTYAIKFIFEVIISIWKWFLFICFLFVCFCNDAYTLWQIQVY